MCLQYTDFSRTVIGSFVPVLSDGSLKREVSLSLQDIHSVLLLSSLLCRANRMRSCRRIDGQRRAGGDGMKHTKEFLADHYLTRRQGKAISTAPILTFLLQQHFITVNFICNWFRDIHGAEDTGGDYQKYTAGIKSDSTCTLCTVWITTVRYIVQAVRVQFQHCSSF